MAEDLFRDAEEQEAFEIWAFGYQPITYVLKDMDAWNSRHGKDLWLHCDMAIDIGVRKMKQLFDKQTKESYAQDATANLSNTEDSMRTCESKQESETEIQDSHPSD